MLRRAATLMCRVHLAVACNSAASLQHLSAFASCQFPSPFVVATSRRQINQKPQRHCLSLAVSVSVAVTVCLTVSVTVSLAATASMSTSNSGCVHTLSIRTQPVTVILQALKATATAAKLVTITPTSLHCLLGPFTLILASRCSCNTYNSN